jgi:hypothetical protein
VSDILILNKELKMLLATYLFKFRLILGLYRKNILRVVCEAVSSDNSLGTKLSEVILYRNFEVVWSFKFEIFDMLEIGPIVLEYNLDKQGKPYSRYPLKPRAREFTNSSIFLVLTSGCLIPCGCDTYSYSQNTHVYKQPALIPLLQQT